MKQLVFLATYWGTKHGGINSFNFDLCQAVAKHVPQEMYQVVCIALQSNERAKSQTEDSKVKLILLDSEKQEFESFDKNLVQAIQSKLRDKGCEQVDWWIGHDVISGEIVLKLREFHDAYPGKVALIHHMDYSAYKSIQNRGENTKNDREKIEYQRKIFRNTSIDKVLAVGPYLYDSAKSICGREVTLLIPGLIEDVEPFPDPPLFNAVTFGRMDQTQDTIKQIRLAAKAFGRSVQKYQESAYDAESFDMPKLWVFGIEDESDDAKTLLENAEQEAERVIAVNPFPYQEDQGALWADIKTFSVCLMLSLHEGFGLAGWEAIGLEVPLILSKQSGLYKFLRKEKKTEGYVQSVDIRGIEAKQGDDIEIVSRCINLVNLHKKEYKNDARELKEELLKKGYTWRKTAYDLLRALEIVPQEKDISLEEMRADGKQQERLAYSRADSFLLPISESKTIDYAVTRLSTSTEQELAHIREAWQEGRKNEACTWIKEIMADKTGWLLLATESKAHIICFEANLELSITGNIERVKTLIEEAQTECPTDDADRILARIAALNENDLEKALDYLAGHDDIDSLNLRAELLLAFGELDECRQLIERKSIHHEPNADTFRIRAFLYLVEKKVYQAQREIQKAIQIKPGWVRIRFAEAVIYYFSALSPAVLPGLLPNRFVNWPEPVDEIFVKHDDESIEFFRKAAAIFHKLLQQAQQEGQMDEVLQTWYVACLANGIESQEEAAVYCRQVLREEEPTDYHLIFWALARNFKIDLAQSIHALEKLFQDNSAGLFHILALARCYIEDQAPKKAVTLLDKTRERFQTNQTEETLWTSWYARSLVANGNFETATEIIKSSKRQEELKHERAIVLQLHAQKTGEWKPYFQQLEDSFQQTADPTFLLELWRLKARQQNWEYLATRAEQFVKNVRTSESLKMAVFAAQYAGQFELCLKLLDEYRELFRGHILPAELRRLQISCLHILGRIPDAIVETEALTHDQKTTEHLLGLANLYMLNGDRESLICVGRQLSQKPDLTSRQALRLASQIYYKDPQLAERLWRKALDQRVPDDQIAQTVVLGSLLGLKHEMTALWRKMRELGERGEGGIQAFSIDEFISAIPQWHEHDQRVSELYQQGSIPTHFWTVYCHRPLVDFYHHFLQENEHTPDLLSHIPLFARYGGRPLISALPKEPSQWHLYLDVTAILLAEYLDILTTIEKEFKPLHIPQSLILALEGMRKQQYTLREDAQRHQTAEWLDNLIRRISYGLTEKTYQFLSLPTDNHDLLKSIQEESAEISCLLNLMACKAQQGDVIWIDDRWASAYSHWNGIPIIGINEILKAIVGAGILEEGDYYAKVTQLRAGNIRFIPFEADEILYHLRQAGIDQHGDVIETRELAILRRYWAACLYQGKILQRPPVPDNFPNKHGEIMFPFYTERAIFGAIVELWASEEKEEIRRAQADWIIRNLYIDTIGWGLLLSLPGVKQHESDLNAFGPIGLIIQAMNLGNSESNRKQGVRRHFFDWLFKRMLQKRFAIDPALITAIAENLKTVLLDNARQLPHNESGEDISWWILQQFYLDLPQPIQKELAHDPDFMKTIGVTYAMTFDVYDLRFQPDEFFEAAHKAMNDKKARVTPIECESHILFHLSKKSEQGKSFYFYHPVNKEKKFVEDEKFELLLDSIEEREAVLRRHREWFDCPADDFEEEVARIVLLENPRQRFEAAETWQNSSTVLFYDKLSWQLRHQQKCELVPQHIEGLLRHLRLRPDIESGEAFQEALTATAQALIEEENLFTAITRLVGLPVVLPAILHESISTLGPQEKRTLVKRLLKNCRSPISRIHLVYLLLRINPNTPSFARLSRLIIRKFMHPTEIQSFETWLAILKWTHEEFNRRAEVRNWPAHIRLTLVWTHAQQLFEIFVAAGYSVIHIYEIFTYQIGHRASFEFFERDPAFWCDVSHPQQIRRLPFLFCGLSYSLDGNEARVIDEEVWRMFAGILFSKEEGLRQIALPLLRDISQAPNSLNAFLGRDRGEILAQLVATDVGENFTHSTLQVLVGQQITKLATIKDDFASWGILREILGDLPLYGDIAERLAPIIKQTDFVQLCEKDVRIGTTITEAVSVLLHGLRHEEVRVYVKEQVIKIAQLFSLRDDIAKEDTEKICDFLIEYARNLALAVQPPLDVVDEFIDILTQLVEIWDAMGSTTKGLVLTLMDELPLAQAQKFWPLLIRLRAS